MPDSDNYYDDSPAPAPNQDGGAGTEQSDDDSQKQTALLPKSIFGGEVKPGDMISLRVEQVQEDEVICSKEDADQEEPQAQPPEEDAPAPQGGGMSSMLED